MEEPILLGDSRSRPSLAPRFLVFGIAVILAVAGLGVRLFQLQLAEGSTYAAYQDVQLTTEKPIPVSRGLIYDRRGKLLVENVPTFVLRIMPAELAFDQRQEVAERIASLTDIKTRRVVELIDRHTVSQYELVRITDIDTFPNPASLIPPGYLRRFGELGDRSGLDLEHASRRRSRGVRPALG